MNSSHDSQIAKLSLVILAAGKLSQFSLSVILVALAIALLAMSLHQSVVLMGSHTVMSVHCNERTALKTEEL